MEDNKLYATIWKTAGTIIIVLILAATASCQNTKWTLKKMVEAGADPLSAACALGGDGKPTAIQCAIHDMNLQRGG